MQQPINNKTPKVCILTSVHSAFDTRIFHKEAKTLLNAGYRVTLIAQHNKNETVDGINIIALPKPRNRLIRFLNTTVRAYKLSLKEKASIYHFHDTELLPFMAILKRKTSSKVIYDIHEEQTKSILSKEWLPRPIRPLISTLFDLLEKSVSKRFDFLISATGAIEKRFRNIGIKKVITVLNYPILTYFEYSKKKVSNGKRLIYAGDLTAIRGIPNIIQALKYLPNEVMLTLVGKISDKQLTKIFETLPKNVEFKGWLPTEKTYEAMFNADIGLLCFLPQSHHVNALPNKLFEYMAAGLSIVASNFPLWREIVNGNRCGMVVNPQDPKEIAGAIQYLIEHPEEARKMGENGRKAVIEKYNWKNEGKTLIETYKGFT